jgi:hypothetical protein
VTGPLLLGYSYQDPHPKDEATDVNSWKGLPKHKDEDQVRLDVDRSFIYYPLGRPHLWSHITMELTLSHRPTLERDRPPEERTVRPHTRGSTPAALFTLLSGLSRYLSGFPLGSRTTE